jgi:hypothetical protein
MQAWLKVLSVFWLAVVTPLFGILPLWCILNPGARSGALCNIERAFLLSVWTLIFPDPAPGVSDVGPPLTERQGLIVIFIVLAIAALSLYYCFRWRKNAKRHE